MARVCKVVEKKGTKEPEFRCDICDYDWKKLDSFTVPVSGNSPWPLVEKAILKIAGSSAVELTSKAVINEHLMSPGEIPPKIGSRKSAIEREAWVILDRAQKVTTQAMLGKASCSSERKKDQCNQKDIL